MYTVVLAGFTAKEQAEEFLAWLDCHDRKECFMEVNYHKTPKWIGDNYVAHLTTHNKGEM